jgi:hypothetical protein
MTGMMLDDKVKTAGQSGALEGGDQRGTRQTNGRCGSGKVADIDWVPEIEIISEALSWGVVAPPQPLLASFTPPPSFVLVPV